MDIFFLHDVTHDSCGFCGDDAMVTWWWPLLVFCCWDL